MEDRNDMFTVNIIIVYITLTRFTYWAFWSPLFGTPYQEFGLLELKWNAIKNNTSEFRSDGTKINGENNT